MSKQLNLAAELSSEHTAAWLESMVYERVYDEIICGLQAVEEQIAIGLVRRVEVTDEQMLMAVRGIMSRALRRLADERANPIVGSYQESEALRLRYANATSCEAAAATPPRTSRAKKPAATTDAVPW